MAAPPAQMQRRPARPKETAPAAAQEVQAEAEDAGEELPALCHFLTRIDPKTGEAVAQACTVPSQFDPPRDEKGEYLRDENGDQLPGLLNILTCEICLKGKQLLQVSGKDPFHEPTYPLSQVPDDWWG